MFTTRVAVVGRSNVGRLLNVTKTNLACNKVNASSSSSRLLIGSRRCFVSGGSRGRKNLKNIGRQQQQQQAGQKVESTSTAIPPTNNTYGEEGQPRFLLANGMIFAGVALFGFFVLDKYFSYKRQSTLQATHGQLESELGCKLSELSNHNNKQYLQSDILFQCVVRRLDKSMEQYFPNLRVGDIVDIIQEGIGPNEGFNLCRTIPKHMKEPVIIGVYPMFCLQPVEDYDTAINNHEEEIKEAASAEGSNN